MEAKNIRNAEYNVSQITQDPFTAISGGDDFVGMRGHSSPCFLLSVESSNLSVKLLETSILSVGSTVSAFWAGPEDPFSSSIGRTSFWFTFDRVMLSGVVVAVFLLGITEPPKVEHKAAKTPLGFKPFGERCILFGSGSSFEINLRFNRKSVSPSSSSDTSFVFLGGGFQSSSSSSSS
ncbi:hypothetical protein OROMI_032673 [Orobanche minor]